MIYLPRSSNYYFIVFLVIGFSALAVVPNILRAFSETSDRYMVAEMNKAQADMYLYQSEYDDFRGACADPRFMLIGFDDFSDASIHLSCATNDSFNALSLYTILSSGEMYCVDSSGNKKYLSEREMPRGYCL